MQLAPLCHRLRNPRRPCCNVDGDGDDGDDDDDDWPARNYMKAANPFEMHKLVVVMMKTIMMMMMRIMMMIDWLGIT